MARTKTTKKKKSKPKKSRKGPSLISRIWNAISPEHKKGALVVVCKLILLVIISVAVVYGFRYLDGYVNNVVRQRNITLKVVMINPPHWASEELIENICKAGGIRQDDFLLEKDLTKKWAANLERCPWVKHLRQVRKYYNGLVKIDCDLREPIAMIEQNGRQYYVDTDGVLLNYIDLPEHVIKLRGWRGKLPVPGGNIKSPDLLAGLQVLLMIRQVDEHLAPSERLWKDLAVLDVANFKGRINRLQSHIKLYTKKNTEIRWGVAVGHERPNLEAPAKYKLASLYRAYKKYGSLDIYDHVELRNFRKEHADPLRNNG